MKIELSTIFSGLSVLIALISLIKSFYTDHKVNKIEKRITHNTLNDVSIGGDYTGHDKR